MPRPKKTHRDFRSEKINAWEAARLLGISERSFYRAVEDGAIPKDETGGYILGDVLAAYVANGRRFGVPFWDLREKLGID